MLNALGFSVLVTSHTNSAVDNVLCKLVPYNLDLLRLGASSKVASTLKDFTEEALMSTATSMEHLDELMKQKVWSKAKHIHLLTLLIYIRMWLA
jgi:hypothetical protein